MNQNILLAMPSTPELLIVLFIVLVIFGGSKIPKLMGGFGKGIKEFKKAVTDEEKKEDTENKKVLATSESTKQLNENSES
jgi:sec-independent protein translocase protein TatA